MDFQEFIDNTLGCSIDTDGFPKGQPYQCVDLAKYFNECYNKGFQIFCTRTGYAMDWATEKETNGILEHFTETSVDNMIKGTLVVWGKCRVAPSSHIGFFVSDNGDGTFKCLQQNAPMPYVTLSNITYDGIIGSFIPKQLLKEEKPTKDDRLYETLGDMYLRQGPSYNYAIRLVKDMSEDGKNHALSDNPDAYAVYKKGTIFTAIEKKDIGYGLWARTPSGWICLVGKSGKEYCKKI